MKMLKALALGLSFWGTAVANVEYTNDPTTIPTKNFADIDQVCAQLLQGKGVPVPRGCGVAYGNARYPHRASEAVPLVGDSWVLRSDYLKVIVTIEQLYNTRRDLLDCFLRYYDMWVTPPFEKFHITDGNLYKLNCSATQTTPPQLVGTMQPAIELAALGLMEIQPNSYHGRQKVTIPGVVCHILRKFVSIEGGNDLVVSFKNPILDTGSLSTSITRDLLTSVIRPIVEGTSS